MKKIIERYGQDFKILIESDKDGFHFALAESVYSLNYKLNYHASSLMEKDAKAMSKKGGYYLFWGPAGDDGYIHHGLSPLRNHNNKKWPLKKAMIEFFKAVKNSEQQSFHFTDKH